MPDRTLTFPDGFLWGTATAAHHVEGQNFNNDWWDWEQSGGKIKNDDSSRVACDWWSGRYREDFDRARALGHNSHRLSVEWSRLEPQEGEWNPAVLRVYRDMLSTLRELGLTPLVTLHHFTNPRWLAAQGGWENPAVVAHFARFAARAVRDLGDLCDFWITINEPNVYASLSYALGRWPPQAKSVGRAFRVTAHLVRAHASAYHAIKQIQPESQIGLAHRFQYFAPHRRKSALDRLAARLRDWAFNRRILTALAEGPSGFPAIGGLEIPEARGTQDFVGLNYYEGEETAFDVRRPGELFGRAVLDAEAHQWATVFTDIGNLNPDGFEAILRDLARYRRPIYITENGSFDKGGDNQSRYLLSHLAAMHRAMQAGAPVKGYYWWTLVDNFEWAEGYGPRFGLYHLDYRTQVRTARPVAEVYAKIIRENGIGPELSAKYVEHR